jgi:purine-nucleoside phosphorylase
MLRTLPAQHREGAPDRPQRRRGVTGDSVTSVNTSSDAVSFVDPFASPDVDPFALARAAAAYLADATGAPSHDVALVLGSGWGLAGELLGETLAEVSIDQVPGFAKPAVAGHKGHVRSVRIGESNRRALVFGTRTHLYEGRGVQAVVHGIRTAAAAGCRIVVLTNGCGGLNPAWGPGTAVLISDHINLTATTPLRGATFIDMTDVYTPRLREVARRVRPELAEGVYVQFRGPQYETPAEVRMAGALGGDLVGMSTTLEAIAAREAGLDVLGVSLVTNLAAGISDEPLSHQEVVEAGREAAQRIGAMLAEIIPLL